MNLLHYLKYFLFHIVAALALTAILAEGQLLVYGFTAVFLFYMLGDAFLGDDDSAPTFKYPGILTVQLWLALPMLTMIVFSAVWSVSSSDFMGYGAWITQLTGYDVIAAREAATTLHHAIVFVLTGLMIGMIGTITAHELTHRTWDPISMLVGRWLLAFSFDTIFSIEHVYGHHVYVSTTNDPATAPRGRNVYHHVVASSIKGNISAWNIEKNRLQRLGRSYLIFTPFNAVIRGHLMSVLLAVVAWKIGGLPSLGFFIACALWGKTLLEIVNYMEHYGMVRDPKIAVQPRHSWNTNSRISSWSMFNLTRHSHHHAQGEVPYQDLRAYPDAPKMASGYLVTILIAMIPPLWHKIMIPKLLAWDRDYATPDERILAARANALSGIPALVNARSPQVVSS